MTDEEIAVVLVTHVNTPLSAEREAELRAALAASGSAWEVSVSGVLTSVADVLGLARPAEPLE